MNWAAFYDSAWHHPGLAWLGCSLALVLASRTTRLRAALVTIIVVTATDAFFTGAFSPVPKDSAWVTPVSIAFVIAGDLRLFALLERERAGAWPRALLVAVPLAFVVPVIQGATIRLWPAVFSEQRRIFLVYELLMVALLVVVLVARRPTKGARRLTLLFLAQYVLWASCDVLLLEGVTAALALRIVPNALYYAVFPIAATRWLEEPT